MNELFDNSSTLFYLDVRDLDKKKRWEMILGKKEDCYYFLEGYWRDCPRLICFCCRIEWERDGKVKMGSFTHWSKKCSGVCKHFRKR